MNQVRNIKTGMVFETDDEYALKRYKGYPDIYEVKSIEKNNDKKKDTEPVIDDKKKDTEPDLESEIKVK